MQTYHTAKRIPDQLPYVVRERNHWFAAGVVLFGALVSVCYAYVDVGLIETAGRGDPERALWRLSTVPLMLMLAAISMYRARRPLVAADERGMWVCVSDWRRKAVWVPWEAVGRIDVRSALLFDTTLVVIPRDRSCPAPATLSAPWFACSHEYPGGWLMVRLQWPTEDSYRVRAALDGLAYRHDLATGRPARWSWAEEQLAWSRFGQAVH